MNQRGRVEEFDAGRGDHGAIDILRKRPSREQQEQRPHALAAGLDDILDQGGHDGKIDRRRRIDAAIHEVELYCHCFEYIRRLQLHQGAPRGDDA